MARNATISQEELEELDRFYRAGGLERMASPHIHYHEPNCPQAGCDQKMEWIDFQLELYGDPEGIYRPLVRAWWDGTGFAGRCPACHGWIHFTSLKMTAITQEQSSHLPQLPDNWHEVAMFGLSS